MNDYERIARIIRYLDERHIEQPDLGTLAAHVSLSQFHFQRLFSSWAGVTPKNFLQCLTLAHAKELLRDGESLLDVALESGLSGPGRLHDLCVNLEAASPGELKSGGAGWTILFGFVDSPFGNCLIAESPRGICHLSFVESKKMSLTRLRNDWPQARWQRDDAAAGRIALKVFIRSEMESSGPRPFPAWAGRGNQPRPTAPTALRALVQGTSFQIRVWRALLTVPPGTLTSYGRLAESIGQPTAARAVGTAVGQNPLAYLIPCHRVIRETGVFGNYRWGSVRKRALVAWESSARANLELVEATNR